MADYEYDIFISYRRVDEPWIRWTKENFVAPLRSFLSLRPNGVKIFLDENIESGASWPNYLAQAHARSRLLIPVLSRRYFDSEWCRLELALMHEREKNCGYRCAAKSQGLIHPVVIDDGNCFPITVKDMQGKRLHSFANPFLKLETPSQQNLTEEIRNWCPGIEDALDDIPPYDPAWEALVHAHFVNVFTITATPLVTIPPLTLHPLP